MESIVARLWRAPIIRNGLRNEMRRSQRKIVLGLLAERCEGLAALAVRTLLISVPRVLVMTVRQFVLYQSSSARFSGRAFASAHASFATSPLLDL